MPTTVQQGRARPRGDEGCAREAASERAKTKKKKTTTPTRKRESDGK